MFTLKHLNSGRADPQIQGGILVLKEMQEPEKRKEREEPSEAEKESLKIQLMSATVQLMQTVVAFSQTGLPIPESLKDMLK